MSKPRIFVHQNESFMRVTPCKALFHSTTIYEVITRGDFFAVNLQTGLLTILKNGSDSAVTEAKNTNRRKAVVQQRELLEP